MQALTRQEPAADVERYLISRLPGILSIGFQAPIGDAAFVGLIREFLGVLSAFPVWAIASACDRWVAEQSRRPAPAELAALAAAAMEHITAELTDRAREDAKRLEAERQAEYEAARAAERVTPDAAARIMAEFGFSSEVAADIASGTVSSPASDPQRGTPQHAALAAARLSARAFLDAVAPIGRAAE